MKGNDKRSTVSRACKAYQDPHLMLSSACSSGFNLKTMKWEPVSDDRETVEVLNAETLIKFIEWEKNYQSIKDGRLNSNETKVILNVPKESVKVSLPLDLITLQNNKRPSENCGIEEPAVKKQKVIDERLPNEETAINLEEDLDLTESEENFPFFQDIVINDNDMNHLISFNKLMLSKNSGDIHLFSPNKSIVEDLVNSPGSVHMYFQEFCGSNVVTDAKFTNTNLHHYASNKSNDNESEDTHSIYSLADSDSTVEIKLPTHIKLPKEDTQTQSNVLKKIKTEILDKKFQEEIISESELENELFEDSKDENHLNNSEHLVLKSPEPTKPSQSISLTSVNENDTKLPKLSVVNKLHLNNNFDYLCLNDELDYEADELEEIEECKRSCQESAEMTDSEEETNINVSNQNCEKVATRAPSKNSNSNDSPKKSSLVPSPKTCTRVKWDANDILKKLTVRIPLKKTSRIAPNSDNELEIHTNITDDLDEEFSRDSTDIRCKTTNTTLRCKTTNTTLRSNSTSAQSSKPPNLMLRSNSVGCQPSKPSLGNKQPEMENEIQGYIGEGLFGKALESIKISLVKDKPNYNSIGAMLKQIITNASSKELSDIILQCCDIYKTNFDYFGKITQEIFDSLVYAGKNLKDALRESLKSVYGCVVRNGPNQIFLQDETCNILLELFINTNEPDWRLVLNVLHFAVGVCRITPRINWVNSVLSMASQFHFLLKTIVKLLTTRIGKVIFPRLDKEYLKKFYDLLVMYKNPDTQLIGGMISDYWPNLLIATENIEPNINLFQHLPNPVTFVPNIGQHIQDCILLQKFGEIAYLFNLGIEKEEYGIIQLIYNEVRNCRERAGYTYKRFINSIHWAVIGTPLHSRQVTIVGQFGIGLMVDLHIDKMYKPAWEILESLHNLNINYYNLQKNIAFMKFYKKSLFFASMLLTANKVALRVVDVCCKIGKILQGFTVLNECNWCQVSNQDIPLLIGEEIEYRRKIFHTMLTNILEISTKINPNDQILKEISINGVRLVEELFKMTEEYEIVEFEALFNQFFVLVINAGLINEVDRLIHFHQSFIKSTIELSPAIQRGILVLFCRSGGNVIPLFTNLTLQGVFFKNSVSKRVVTVKSFLTTEELVMTFRFYLDKIFQRVTMKSYKTFAEKYLLKIKVELHNLFSKDFCGVTSLQEGSSLENCYIRITEALTKKLRPPLEISQKETINSYDHTSIVVKPYSVYMYFAQNFNFTDTSMLECPSFTGGTQIPNPSLAASSVASFSGCKSSGNAASTSGFNIPSSKLNQIYNIKNKPPKGVKKLTPCKRREKPQLFPMLARKNRSDSFGTAKAMLNFAKNPKICSAVENTVDEPLLAKSPNIETCQNETAKSTLNLTTCKNPEICSTVEEPLLLKSPNIETCQNETAKSTCKNMPKICSTDEEPLLVKSPNIETCQNEIPESTCNLTSRKNPKICRTVKNTVAEPLLAKSPNIETCQNETAKSTCNLTSRKNPKTIPKICRTVKNTVAEPLLVKSPNSETCQNETAKSTLNLTTYKNPKICSTVEEPLLVKSPNIETAKSTCNLTTRKKPKNMPKICRTVKNTVAEPLLVKSPNIETCQNETAKSMCNLTTRKKPKNMPKICRTVKNTVAEPLLVKSPNIETCQNETKLIESQFGTNLIKSGVDSLTPKSPNILPPDQNPINSKINSTNTKYDVSDIAKKKIEQFIITYLRQAKKDNSEIETLTTMFVEQMCLKLHLKVLKTLTPKIMAELNSFIKTMI